MNDPNTEYTRLPDRAEEQSSRVMIAVIVSVMIVMLACIAACTAVLLVFLYNAPW